MIAPEPTAFVTDIHSGEATGHGVDIDETLAVNYPYHPEQLPIARLGDGTMWNWQVVRMQDKGPAEALREHLFCNDQSRKTRNDT